MIKEKELLSRIETALDSVRPYLEMDGGNVEVVEVDQNNVLRLKWVGNCKTCEMSHMTMKAGIEETIKKAIPEITSVVAN